MKVLTIKQPYASLIAYGIKSMSLGHGGQNIVEIF